MEVLVGVEKEVFVKDGVVVEERSGAWDFRVSRNGTIAVELEETKAVFNDMRKRTHFFLSLSRESLLLFG